MDDFVELDIQRLERGWKSQFIDVLYADTIRGAHLSFCNIFGTL
jgi:hypothetical protein